MIQFSFSNPIKMEEAGNYFVKLIVDGKSIWMKLENVR